MINVQDSNLQDVEQIPKVDHSQDALPLTDPILLAKEAANLAVELTKQGDIQGSIVSYKKAIELNPRPAVWIYKALGNQMLKCEQSAEAIEILMHAVERFSGVAELYTILAACFQKQGNIEQAIKNYCQAILLDSGSPTWVYRELANQLAIKLNSAPLEDG